LWQGNRDRRPVTMIETWGIGKTYSPPLWGLAALGRRSGRVDALRDVTLHVARGEVFGLMGPNGAGKTTLLRLLATLLPPSTGGGRIGGSDLVRQARTVRRLIGLASGEERGFYWRLSGRENLEFIAGLLGMAPRAGRERADQVLEMVDLLPMAHQSVAQYSTGMRQRLGIARALLGRPAVLLLDEPTRSLDPMIAAGVQTLVRRLAADAGTTVVLATHNLEEAERICNRVAILVGGRLRALVRAGSRDQSLASEYTSILAVR
jgi:ABC-2 type transport system ATP-binding protein